MSCAFYNHARKSQNAIGEMFNQETEPFKIKVATLVRRNLKGI